MGRVQPLKLQGKTVRVASNKHDYIRNIVKCAEMCDHIQKIVLFGSVLESRCRDQSDIDIAVFGDLPEGKMLALNSYVRFSDGIYDYKKPDFFQDYDVLYFKTGDQQGGITHAIENGVVIYERAQHE